MRINKFLASSGFCSRRKADTLIADGHVTINGNIAKLGDDVKDHDIVKVDEKQIILKEQRIYLAFHKPVGVISTADPNADNTIFDYVDVPERVFYIGRLDVASSGLMILTDDGDLAQKVARPEFGHEKEYIVTVNEAYNRKFIDGMKSGVVLDDGTKTKPAHFKREGKRRFRLIITEGKNRQIRRMCEALGYEVTNLKRVRVMNVRLGDLGPGNWRQLTKKERRGLLESI